MTKILKSITLLLSLFIILPVWAQQNNLPTFDLPHAHRGYNQTRNINSDILKYDVIYQRLNFKVNPSIYYINGEVSIHYQSLDNLDSLIVNLSESLLVDSITQRNNQVSFIHQNHTLKINIEDIGTAILDSISIFYQGEPSHENEAFFIGVQDSTSYTPVLATLSEPYGSSDWWPCKDNLTDKIDSIDISITCPLGNKAASLGLLKSIEYTASEVTYHWQHRYPVTPYLVSIAVSDYSEYHSYIHYNNNDSILFMNYLYQNDLASKQTQIDKTESFFQVFDSLFISYPFTNEKYGHAEFPIGGGMEHQTISSMGKFDYEIISHELAHQWFGDYITCGSWEDLWLNEGYATYLTGLCYENLQDGYWWPFWKEVTVDKITIDSTGTIFPTDTNDLSILFSSRLTYRKASYLLHMIRWTIGDDDFFQSIRNYLNDEELAFSFAKTPDLIAHFEQQSDTSLTEFMNDWFYGEGYPIYNIEWSQNAEQTFHVQINQSSALNDNHFFKLYVPVRLIGQNDTLDLKLNNQFNNQSFNLPINFIVDTVIFDPKLWLISKYSSVELTVKEVYNKQINIFPNPCKEGLTIEINERILGLSIIDIKGEIMNINYQNGVVNLSSLSPGVYFIKINTGNNRYTKKIIKL